MNKNIKSSVLYIGLFYMIIIPILMVISYCNMVTSIDFSSNDEYKNKINSYKERLSFLEESNCKSYLNTLIDKIESDINTENINLKEYYERINSENNLLSFYSEAAVKCNSITNEKMQEVNMPISFLTPLVIRDEIVGKYIYQYELGFSDYHIRSISASNLIPVENNIVGNSELQIIENIMKIIDWEKEA